MKRWCEKMGEQLFKEICGHRSERNKINGRERPNKNEKIEKSKQAGREGSVQKKERLRWCFIKCGRQF